MSALFKTDRKENGFVLLVMASPSCIPPPLGAELLCWEPRAALPVSPLGPVGLPERKESPRNKRGAFCYYHENPHTFGQVINHRWSLTVYSSFSGCLTWNPGGWFAKCWVLEAVIEVSGSCALNIYWAIKTLSTQKHQTGTPKSVGPLTLISLWLSSPSVKWEYCHPLVSQGCCEFRSVSVYKALKRSGKNIAETPKNKPKILYSVHCLDGVR